MNKTYLFIKQALRYTCFYCLCGILQLNAQSEFATGFIIRTNGDTLHGLLKEEINVNAYDIQYKRTAQSELKIYTIKEVHQYFLSTEGLYERNEIVKAGVLSSVYLKYQIDGLVDFYTYTDDRLYERFFIKNREGSIRELIIEKKEKIDEVTKQRVRYTQKPFIGELKFALKECAALTADLDKLELSREDIYKTIAEYHLCINESFIDFNKGEKKKQRINIEFGVLLGNHFTLTDRSFDLGRSISPFINYYLPKSKNRYSIELRYKLMEAQKDSEPSEQYASIPIRFNRYFKMNNHRLFTKVGFDYNLPPTLVANLNFAGGVGYVYSIKNLSIIANIEYLFNYRFYNYNIGLSYQL
jgi:hypothetical protein